MAFVNSSRTPAKAGKSCSSATAVPTTRPPATQRCSTHRRTRYVLSYPGNRGKGICRAPGIASGSAESGGCSPTWTSRIASRTSRVSRRPWRLADVAIGVPASPESRLVVPTRVQGYLPIAVSSRAWCFPALVRRLLPLKQLDTQAGLKGLSARAVRLICPLLECDGFGFDCELLVLCRRLRIPAVEVPVTMQYDGQPSTTGWRAFPQMLREIWRVRERWKNTKVLPVVFTAEEWAERQAA